MKPDARPSRPSCPRHAVSRTSSPPGADTRAAWAYGPALQNVSWPCLPWNSGAAASSADFRARAGDLWLEQHLIHEDDPTKGTTCILWLCVAGSAKVPAAAAQWKQVLLGNNVIEGTAEPNLSNPVGQPLPLSSLLAWVGTLIHCYRVSPSLYNPGICHRWALGCCCHPARWA
jgi:hypothetical protein